MAAVFAGACVGGGGADGAGAGAAGGPSPGSDLSLPNTSPIEKRSSRDLRCGGGGDTSPPFGCSSLFRTLLKKDRFATLLLSVQTMLLAPWRVMRVCMSLGLIVSRLVGDG